MNAYDIFLYLSTFLIVIPMAVFCLFPVIDHLKHPLSHLLCKIGLVFVCYFIIVFIVYLVLKRDLGNALMFPAVPVFLLSIPERDRYSSICLSFYYADCLLSWCFVLYCLPKLRHAFIPTWSLYNKLYRIYSCTAHISDRL